MPLVVDVYCKYCNKLLSVYDKAPGKDYHDSCKDYYGDYIICNFCHRPLTRDEKATGHYYHLSCLNSRMRYDDNHSSGGNRYQEFVYAEDALLLNKIEDSLINYGTLIRYNDAIQQNPFLEKYDDFFNEMYRHFSNNFFTIDIIRRKVINISIKGEFLKERNASHMNWDWIGLNTYSEWPIYELPAEIFQFKELRNLTVNIHANIRLPIEITVFSTDIDSIDILGFSIMNISNIIGFKTDYLFIQSNVKEFTKKELDDLVANNFLSHVYITGYNNRDFINDHPNIPKINLYPSLEMQLKGNTKRESSEPSSLVDEEEYKDEEY